MERARVTASEQDLDTPRGDCTGQSSSAKPPLVPFHMNLQADTPDLIPLTLPIPTRPRRGQIVALLAYIAKYFPGGVQTLSLGGQMREFGRGCRH